MKLLSVLTLLVLTSCAAMTMHAPALGTFYTNAVGPGLVGASTSTQKVGEAVCKSYLGWIADGDCSIDAAKKNGGITKVTSVDYKTSSILGIYAELTTVVRGE